MECNEAAARQKLKSEYRNVKSYILFLMSTLPFLYTTYKAHIDE